MFHEQQEGADSVNPYKDKCALNDNDIPAALQAHYTEILLRDMAGIDFSKERIFSQTVSGRPKGEVLHALAAKHPEASERIFVEDKLGTLEKVQ